MLHTQCLQLKEVQQTVVQLLACACCTWMPPPLPPLKHQRKEKAPTTNSHRLSKRQQQHIFNKRLSAEQTTGAHFWRQEALRPWFLLFKSCQCYTLKALSLQEVQRSTLIYAPPSCWTASEKTQQRRNALVQQAFLHLAAIKAPLHALKFKRCCCATLIIWLLPHLPPCKQEARSFDQNSMRHPHAFKQQLENQAVLQKIPNMAGVKIGNHAGDTAWL